MKIVFANGKGGVGKSTLCKAAGYVFSKLGRTLLADADWQRSIERWREGRSSPLPPSLDVIGFGDKHLREDLSKHYPYYEHIVIDTPGIAKNDQVVRMAMIESDCIIIPCRYASTDIRSTAETVDLATLAIKKYPHIKAYLLINENDPRTSMKSEVGNKIADMLDGSSVTMLKTEITGRVVFDRSDSKGLFVQELDKKGDATREIEEFVKEILDGQAQ